MLEIFSECSYSIWLHIDTKSKLISIRSQVLHHFVCYYVKCVEKVPFRKSGHNYHAIIVVIREIFVNFQCNLTIQLTIIHDAFSVFHHKH